MAKAIGCPIGFAAFSKGRETGLSQPTDPLLSQLHDYQASPVGLIEGHVAGLVSTVTALKDLSDDPALIPTIAAEVTSLDAVHAHIGDLIARIGHTERVRS